MTRILHALCKRSLIPRPRPAFRRLHRKTDLVILHSFLRSSNYKQVLKHIHSYICIPPTTASVHVHYTKMLIMNATVSRRARSRVYFNLQHNRISGTYNIREYCHPVHRQKKQQLGVACK